MPRPAEFLHRYRVALLALTVSAALHAAVVVGMPPRIVAVEDDAPQSYSATLDPPAALVESTQPVAVPAAAPHPRGARTHVARARIALPPPLEQLPVAPDLIPLDPMVAVQPAVTAPASPAGPEAIAPPPDQIAIAQPALPLKEPDPEPFPVDSLPARMTIDYRLTSVFADGHATYRWDREGDSYTISAEAEAEGFFTLFLEGRIVQESRGTVTASGLRPDWFSERKPGGPPEGLEFDWAAKQVTFDRNGERKTGPLTDNTVDWLSMIFQLAHLPPKGESFDMQVFTQRRMYRFHLKVLGIEEIDIPLGRVRALHLRHVDPEDDKELVDVWLGLDQHYLPVKMRFPAARNRFVIEQVATHVTSR
jgi:hypothetical protein